MDCLWCVEATSELGPEAHWFWVEWFEHRDSAVARAEKLNVHYPGKVRRYRVSMWLRGCLEGE